MSTRAPGNNTNDSSGELSWVDPEPSASRVFRFILFSVTVFCAVVGNLVICRAIFRRSGRKTLVHYLVSNMALAELVFSVCQAFVFHEMEPPYGWALGSALCKFLLPLQLMCGITITSTLAVIAVYRCLILQKAIYRRPSFSQSICIISVIWITALALALPTAVFRDLTEKDGNVYCQENFPEGLEHHQNAYSIVLFVANYVIPLAIMGVSYALVSCRIKEHMQITTRLMEQQHPRGTSFTNTDDIKLTDMQNQVAPLGEEQEASASAPARIRIQSEKDRHHEKSLPERNCDSKGQMTLAMENDLLKMIYAIILVYVICYLPFQVNFLLLEFKVLVYRNWKYLFMCSRYLFNIICLPSALHPLLYGTMSRFYRTVFYSILSGCK